MNVKSTKAAIPITGFIIAFIGSILFSTKAIIVKKHYPFFNDLIKYRKIARLKIILPFPAGELCTAIFLAEGFAYQSLTKYKK